MRVFVFALLVLAIICICEAKKHKNRDTLKQKGLKIERVKGPNANPYHRGRKYRPDRIRGQHLFSGRKQRKGKKWMRFPKKSACKATKCGPKEVCMVHPNNGMEKCINKHDFREGRRLFKQFHKQKKFLKNEAQVKDLEAQLLKGEHLKDVFDLMNHHIKTRFHDHKRWKKQHIKDIEEKQDMMIKEAKNVHECRATEISELKKRLIGWFDVIHTESRQARHRLQDQEEHLLQDQEPRRFKNHRDILKKGHYKMTLYEGQMKAGKAHLQHKDHRMNHHHRQQRSVHDAVDRESHGGCMCSKSVMWEFRKQDMTNDGHLTEREMVVMESNRREPCMKPLLKSCDRSGDGQLTRGEWCCCFQETVAPCLEKQRRSNPEDWVPRCDKEGYFQREQCHKSGHCWCSDINGNVIENTKVKGKADCGKYGPNGYLTKQ